MSTQNVILTDYTALDQNLQRHFPEMLWPHPVRESLEGLDEGFSLEHWEKPQTAIFGVGKQDIDLQ